MVTVHAHCHRSVCALECALFPRIMARDHRVPIEAKHQRENGPLRCMAITRQGPMKAFPVMGPADG